MTSIKDPIQEIKKVLSIELKDCNKKLWPKVCELQSTPEGYQRIEEMVITYAAKEAMPIDAALALIEQELDHL